MDAKQVEQISEVIGNARDAMSRTRQELEKVQATLAQLEAAIRADRAQVDIYRVQLSYTTISAPINGRSGALQLTLGNMVNRHAWRFFGTPKWTKLDLTEIPEAVPTAAKAGTQALVVVRQGDTVYAIHAQCAHAGGPLAEGKLVDGCIQCPWHGSCFEPATGRRKRGPSTFDQPRYDVRAAEGGGWEVLRVGGTRGQNV